MKKQILLFIVGLISIGLSAQTFTASNGILNGTVSQGRPCVADMNGDHLDDVVRIVNTNLVIDYQQTDGTFIMETYNAGIDNPASWSIAAGDIDGNGFNDLILGSGSEISFVYANDTGDGYSEVNVPDYIFSQRTNFIDIDNDGHLDAFACHDVDTSHPYRNDGNGNLTEDQSLIQTVPLGGNYASIWCDFDNDGDQDMYMSKCRQGTSSGDPQRENALYVNDGTGNFTEMAAEYGLWDNEQSWVTIFEDFDNDGDFDTYTVNHTDVNRLKENDGTGHYTEITMGSGIDMNDLDSWACIGADFDNDGLIDILTESNVNKEFYHNDGDMQFTPVNMPFDDGALGDLNNDGFIDVYTGGTLYLNDGNDNNWIKVALEGIQSNVNGIGSRIEIYGDFGIKIRECRSGEGFHPGSSLDVFFGIGTSESIDSMMVHWPSGIVTVVDAPAINQLHVIPEGSCFFESQDITANGPTTICPGESVTLAAPEGYDYLWSNGETGQEITVTEGGSYQVNLTDSESCISVSNQVFVEIVVDETPSIIMDGEERFCEGEATVLISSEANGYLWNTGEDSQFLNVTETGEYSVTIQGQCGTAESEIISIEVLPAPVPAVDDQTVPAPGLYTVDAIGEGITWYSDEAGTDVIGTGTSIEVDVPLEGLTIYADNLTEHEGIQELGGKLDNAGGGGLPATGGVSFFDVWEAFTLDQVTVYALAGQAGTRTVQLIDENEDVIYSEDIFIDEGEQTLNLGWEIPVAEGMALRCTQNNLFRNNDNVNYPYAIGTVGEIYGSTWGPTYYYFFYDWRISRGSLECPSDIVAVEINVQPTGLDELSGMNGFSMFPNPVEDVLNLEWNQTSVDRMDWSILDANGRVVRSQQLGDVPMGAQRITIELDGLARGVYQLQIIGSEGTSSNAFVKH